jgi:putative peptidoglycan lipid II flippase
MVPITVLTIIVRQPVVEILFGSGKITQPNLDLIASTLAFFAIGLTAHALIAVLARGFYARQDTVTPVLAAIAAVAINSTLAIVLVEPYGLQGIALAIAAAAWIEALALLAILHHRLPHFEFRGLARVAIEAVVGSVLAGAVAFLASQWLENAIGGDPGRLLAAVEVVLVSLVFALVYAAISLVLRIPELPSIVGVMADVLRRPARS